MALNPTLVRMEGTKAQALLRLAGVVKDAETLTVGPYVFEVDTRDTAHVTAGRIRLNLSGGTTVKAQGTATIDTRFTIGDTFTIGTKTYTVATTPTNPGDVARGADAAGSRAAMIAAINGTDGINSADANVVASAGTGTVVLTAIVGGTGGNSIATTETFAAGTNVFDAATLGTTTAGVDASAENFIDALVAAFPEGAGVLVKVTKISASVLLLEAVNEGAFAYATTETLATSNNAWSVTKMAGGQAAGVNAKFLLVERVPTAVEDLADLMYFPIDFKPKYAQALVYTTSSGAQVLWNGKITLNQTGPKFHVALDNSGTVDWSVNETVSLLIIG